MQKKSKPYALLINDIHITKDNISEFQRNWEEALKICKEAEIEEIVIGGDLWTTTAAQTLPVLLAVRQAIMMAAACKIELLIAEGNHDLIDKESYLGYSHLFSEYPGVTVVDDFVLEELDNGLMLAVMSYFPENGSFVEHLNELKYHIISPAKTILYIHEGINGGLAHSSDDELPANIFDGFKKVLVGHYHDRTQVGSNIFYIGASRQHNFGEDEHKGYTILYSDGETKFVQNSVNTRYATVPISDQLTIEEAKEQIQQYVAEGKKVRVKIECKAEAAKAIDKQALLDLGVNKIEIKTESISVETASQAMETKYDKTGIKKEYTSFCQSKGIDDVETGLKYLDKINCPCGV